MERLIMHYFALVLRTRKQNPSTHTRMQTQRAGLWNMTGQEVHGKAGET